MPIFQSASHGLVTEFDTFGSSSGTLDLQGSVTQSNINGQSYAFNFTGTSGFNVVLCTRHPGGEFLVSYATVGAFTLDASGNISTGIEDFNNNCISSGSTSVPVTAGGITLGQQGFGTATITAATTPSPTTYSFDVFPIDATHLKLIETDSFPAGPFFVLVGDAFTQASSIPAGNNVFTVAGFDNSLLVMGPFTSAGILHTDGTTTILPDSVQDTNEVDHTRSGVSVNATFSGTYTAMSSGRAEFTLNNFINGNDGGTAGLCGPCLFAVYPSSGGLLMLEIDGLGSTDGIVYPQTATTLPSGQGFGMNLSGLAFGVSTGNPQDNIAQFTNANGNFTGMTDFNAQATLIFGNNFWAQYSADTTVPGRGTVAGVTNSVNFTTYVVDSSTAVVLSTDATFLGLGALVQQNLSARSNIVANHLAVLRINSSASANLTRKQTPPTRPK